MRPNAATFKLFVRQQTMEARLRLALLRDVGL